MFKNTEMNKKKEEKSMYKTYMHDFILVIILLLGFMLMHVLHLDVLFYLIHVMLSE